MLGFISSLEKSGLTLMCKDDIATQYYIRVSVIDKIGVLSKISEVLGKHSISISSFIQKQDSKKSECAVLLFSTHTCKEKDIQKALCDISDLEFVERKPTMIRIES